MLELQDVNSKLDKLLLRIPADFHVPATPLPSVPPYPLQTTTHSDISNQLSAVPPPWFYTSPRCTITTTPLAPQPLPSDGLSTSAPVPTNSGSQLCIPGDKTRTLLLGNGHSIMFTAQDVPPPPTTTFMDDIPRLNSMWDDTSTHWAQDSVLKIQGHPIALVYWPIVYTRWRSGDWDTLKTQFGHWKVCY
jgi:hypothetical protein